MNTTKSTAAGKGTFASRFWYAFAMAAERSAVMLGFLARGADTAAKRFAAAVAELRRLATWARHRATGLPAGADLAGAGWEQAPVLPPAPLTPTGAVVRPAPPPVPVVTGFEKRNVVAAVDEEREWQTLIAGVKAADVADEWTMAIRQAKARTNARSEAASRRLS